MIAGSVTVSITVTQSNPKAWNSPIHGGDGQTVGYSDAHATFEKRPDVGSNNDCIWTTTGASGPNATGTLMVFRAPARRLARSPKRSRPPTPLAAPARLTSS